VREFVKLEKQLWQANGLDKKPIVGIEDAAELCYPLHRVCQT
jgi:hypothetical protein